MLKCLTHGKNAGNDTTVVRNLVTNDGAGSSIHDKPDKSFDTANFDVGFVGGKYRGFWVVIVVYKRLKNLEFSIKNI